MPQQPQHANAIPKHVQRRLLATLGRLLPGRTWTADTLVHYVGTHPFARALYPRDPEVPAGFPVGWHIVAPREPNALALTVVCEGTPQEFADAQHIVLVRSVPDAVFLVPHSGALQRRDV